MSSNEQTVRTVTLLTAPHDGSRGTAFLEFERRFKSNMIAEFIGDEDFSAWECCIGMDQGGNGDGAPAMPALNANNRDQLIRKRIKRQAFAYKLVFRHINDPRLRELLRHPVPTHAASLTLRTRHYRAGQDTARDTHTASVTHSRLYRT